MIHIHELSSLPYISMLEQQRTLFAEMVEHRRMGREIEHEHIFFVEHLPVYTIGRHGDRKNLRNRAFLEQNGVELVEIERGGDITFHGPGQLVAYPIVDFGRRGMGVKEYVGMLEEAVIRTIGEFGITGSRIEGATGVWIGAGTEHERKICAIGIKCSRFIAMHGLALNVDTDLRWFDAINPCGFTDRGVTSISAETGRSVTVRETTPILRHHLLDLLNH